MGRIVETAAPGCREGSTVKTYIDSAEQTNFGFSENLRLLFYFFVGLFFFFLFYVITALNLRGPQINAVAIARVANPTGQISRLI